jgi:hypothetical protein
VGGLDTSNNIYCRRCIRLLGKDWGTMKYITNARAKTTINNCTYCGKKLTKKRAEQIY